jgi:hypothetical protein
VEIHCSSLESREPNRARCARQTSTDNKIKASRRRQLKNLVAVNLFSEVFQAEEIGSSIATGAWLNLIIDRLKNVCQPLPMQVARPLHALVDTKERVS